MAAYINIKYYNFQDELIALRHTDNDIMMQNERSNKYIISKIMEMLERINVLDQNLDITTFLCFCLVDNFSYSILRQTDLGVDVSIEQCAEMILRYTKLN
ncbi:MAG: hypothetical protein ACM34K_00290 [Bacillota bacterium]